MASVSSRMLHLSCALGAVQVDMAVKEYEKAVELQPGYVTAWNNLGDAYEKQKNWRWVCS